MNPTDPNPELAALKHWATDMLPTGLVQARQVLALLDDHARLTALADELLDRVAAAEPAKPKWTKASGKAIRKRRNDLGLSLIPPAKHLKISAATLSKWERAEDGPTRDQLFILNQFYEELEADPSACLDLEDTNEEKQSS